MENKKTYYITTPIITQAAIFTSDTHIQLLLRIAQQDTDASKAMMLCS